MLGKLHTALFDVENTRQLLNNLLKRPIGNNRYRIVKWENPDFAIQHKLISASAAARDGELFFASADAEVRAEIDRFLTPLVEQPNSVDAARLTDYRHYFDFDMEVDDLDELGNVTATSRVDRQSGKFSGGENQSPYFIAILASYLRAYKRHDTRSKKPSLALVPIDEAFSKLSGERIKNCIEALKSEEIDLQRVFSMSAGNIPYAFEHCDSLVVVAKEERGRGRQVQIRNIPMSLHKDSPEARLLGIKEERNCPRPFFPRWRRFTKASLPGALAKGRVTCSRPSTSSTIWCWNKLGGGSKETLTSLPWMSCANSIAPSLISNGRTGGRSRRSTRCGFRRATRACFMNCLDTRRPCTNAGSGKNFSIGRLRGQSLNLSSRHGSPFAIGTGRTLRDDLPLFHWGDTDPSGFEILGVLRRKSGRNISALHMRYGLWAESLPTETRAWRTLTPDDRRKLNRLLADKDLKDVRTELQKMWDAGNTGDYEQEGLPLPWPAFPYIDVALRNQQS